MKANLQIMKMTFKKLIQFRENTREKEIQTQGGGWRDKPLKNQQNQT